jgi:hypothetical protein
MRVPGKLVGGAAADTAGVLSFAFAVPPAAAETKSAQ